MHGVFLGDFSRWLTHAHLFSSCYQSLFHSKVICTYDPSCSSAANSRVTAVKRALCAENPTLSSAERTKISSDYLYLFKNQPLCVFFPLRHQYKLGSISAASGVEKWNRSVVSDKKLRFCQIPEPGIQLVHKNKQIICTFLLILHRSTGMDWLNIHNLEYFRLACCPRRFWV